MLLNCSSHCSIPAIWFMGQNFYKFRRQLWKYSCEVPTTSMFFRNFPEAVVKIKLLKIIISSNISLVNERAYSHIHMYCNNYVVDGHIQQKWCTLRPLFSNPWGLNVFVGPSVFLNFKMSNWTFIITTLTCQKGFMQLTKCSGLSSYGNTVKLLNNRPANDDVILLFYRGCPLSEVILYWHGSVGNTQFVLREQMYCVLDL